MAVRFAGDIFLNANKFGADDSDPGKYTSDNYLAAINQGGFDFGGKDSRTRWADVQDVDNNGYGDLLTPAARARLEEDKSNPLYQKAAQDLGINRFGSANDMAQVVKHLSEGGTARDDYFDKSLLERDDYKQAAQRIGIKNFNSKNDLDQVERELKRA